MSASGESILMLSYEGIEYHTGTWNGWASTEHWEMDRVNEAISQCLHSVILLLHVRSSPPEKTSD